MSRRYSGRAARAGGGLGLLPMLILAALVLTAWNMHGGHVPFLSEIQAAIFD